MNQPRTSGVEPTSEATHEPSRSPTAIPVQVQVIAGDYANFCRISGTPEELLIDFGLNTQPAGPLTKPIVVSQRIVTSWHTAKRLLGVLQMTVARHEAAFGVLETDVQKRIRRS